MRKALLLAVMLTSCVPVSTTQQAAVTGTVWFTAERVSPDTFRLALDNGASGPIGYNLCTSVLERLEGTAWAVVPDDTVCTMQLLTLNPGHDATFEKRLPDALPHGQYRFTASIENPAGSPPSRVSTDPFTL